MKEEMSVPRIAMYVVRLIGLRPWLALFLGVLTVGLMVPGLGRLKADFTHRYFFYDDDPLLVQFNQFERQFGNDDVAIVAIHSPSGVFDLETANLVNTLTEKMWKVPEVIRVDSLANYNWVHASGDDIAVERFFPDDGSLSAELLAARQQIALKDETLPNYLVSKDSKTTLVYAHIRPGIESVPNPETITLAIRKLVDELKGGDHQFYISGGPPLSHAFKEAAEKDLSRLIPALVVLVMIILAILLRSVAGVLLPFVVAISAIIGALGLGGYFNIIQGNISTMLPNILIAVSIADAVHILVTFYTHLKQGMARADAARVALLKNFVPTFLTSFTTAVGFMSFGTATLKPLNGLGAMAAFGTTMAWVTSYLIVGSLLFILPLKPSTVRAEEINLGDTLANRYVEWILSKKTFVIVGIAIFCVVGVTLSLKTDVNSDPLKYFRKGWDAREANEFIEATVGGARGVEIVFDAGTEEGIKDPEFLRKIDTFEEWVEQQPRVTKAVSIVDILKATHRSLNADDPKAYALAADRETISQELFLYTMSLPQGMDLNDRISLKNDALRMSVLWTIPTSKESVAFIKTIEDKTKEMGLVAHVTGKYRLWQGMNSYVVRSFITSFFTAAITISVIIMIALRSIGFGLLAMIPNLVPLVFSGAFLFLIGQYLDVGTVFVASVVLGIAVDDTIHILANFRRAHLEGRSGKTALVETFSETSPALLATTGILIAGFGVFSFAAFMPNVFFGLLTAVTLLVAVVIEFSLTPVLLGWKLAAAKKTNGAGG